MKKFLLLLLLIFLSLPYLLGFEIENRYRGLLAEFESAGYLFNQYEYERGFYQSIARTNLIIPVYRPQGPVSNIEITIVSHIDHGPYTASFEWLGDLAQFHTDFYQYDVPVLPETKQPKVLTRISFTGEGVTELKLPALEHPLQFDKNLFIDFFGLTGSIHFNVDQDKMDMNLQSEGIDITSLGEGKLLIGGVNIQSSSQRGIEGLMLGQGTLGVEKVIMEDLKRNFSLITESIQVSADTHAVAKNIDMSAQYHVGAVLVDGITYGPGQLNADFNSVSAVALSKIQESMKQLRKVSMKPDQQGMAIMETMMNVLPEILEQNPRVSIRPFSLDTPDGRILIRFSLTTNVMKKDLKTMSHLVQSFVANASIRIPKVILKKLLSRNVKQRIQVALLKQDKQMDEMALDTLVMQKVDNQLSSFIAQGFIKASDNDFTSNLHFEAGLLSINGKVFPVFQEQPQL